MPDTMPERLERWLRRVVRIEKGYAELTRAEAVSARNELELDARAFPDEYAPFAADLSRVVDALTILSVHRTRREDLLQVVASENRERRRDRPDEEKWESELAHTRSRVRAELDRIPRGLPPVLDEWCRRAIRSSLDLVPMDPRDAWRGEATIRSDRAANPAGYAPRWVRTRFDRTVEQLGELATRERPGSFSRSRSVRTISSDLQAGRSSGSD